MESYKIAFFCWESMYAERVGGLANAATNLAETLVKQNHEVHFFTRGSIPDQTINGVEYHHCRPAGNNIVEYCDNMSIKMVDQFRKFDAPHKFDFLHFHDWHPGPGPSLPERPEHDPDLPLHRVRQERQQVRGLVGVP
jgi:glycogen synthase